MTATRSTGTILVTGANGQVGGELLHTLAGLGEVLAPRRDAMDLADSSSVRAAIRAAHPRWIVNSGAYTAVDKAEAEPELAYAVNADAVGVMGDEAQAIGAGVIHLSTDYVFDGTAPDPYVEQDTPRPVSVYGASKLAGEQALAESGAGHIILRTSWVYGARGKNFLLTILKLAAERETLRIVADQHGAPTWSRDLARLIAAVIADCENRSGGGAPADVLAEQGGLYHAAGAGETTWYGFAAEAVRLRQVKEPAKRLARIEAITTAEYPTPARRPENSRLNCGKLEARFGWKMMDWRESVRQVMLEI